MFSKEVKTKAGVTKNIMADNQAELDEAVKVAENEEAPTYPNINHPVKKGHDLVGTTDDLSSVMIDGTGAHNSPNDAIRPDGKEEGDPNVPAFDHDEPEQIDSVQANLGNREGDEKVETHGKVNPSIQGNAKKDLNKANKKK